MLNPEPFTDPTTTKEQSMSFMHRGSGEPRSYRFTVAAIAGVLGVYGALCLTHADALRAAGVNGKPPPQAGAISKFVGTITDNATWFIGTVAGLAILTVAGLFFFGVREANNYAAKIAVGSVLVIAAPGLAA